MAWCAACLEPVTHATGTILRGQTTVLIPGWAECKGRDRMVYTCHPCGHTGRDSADGRSLETARNLFGFMP